MMKYDTWNRHPNGTAFWYTYRAYDLRELVVKINDDKIFTIEEFGVDKDDTSIGIFVGVVYNISQMRKAPKHLQRFL